MENIMMQLEKVEKPTKSEKQIINYIKSNPIEIVRMNLTQLAEAAESSNSAIIRLCKKLGYQGFSEFKFDMSRYILSGKSANQTITGATDVKGRLAGIAGKYVTYINSMIAELDITKITNLAQRICRAHYIVIIGYNRTGLSAQQCSMRLSKIGVPNKFIAGDVALMNDYASILGKKDLTIIFSITGANMYTSPILQLKDADSPVILISMNPQTNLRKLVSDMILLPRISRTNELSFLDDQALFFIFVEMLISEVANLL